MMVTTYKISRVPRYILSCDKGTFELTFAPVEDTAHVHVTDTHAIIGYLALDTDSENPLTASDCMGRICHRGRDASHEEERAFHEALGLNEYWGRDLDLVETILRDDTATDWDVGAMSDNDLRDHWERLRKEGKICNPYAVKLDIYEHGMRRYSVSGFGIMDPWDTTRGGAIWIPDECCLEAIMAQPPEAQRAKAVEMAEAIAEEYSNWCNGEVYGVVIEHFDLVEKEWVSDEDRHFAVWNYIGSAYAESELKREFDKNVEDLSNA